MTRKIFVMAAGSAVALLCSVGLLIAQTQVQTKSFAAAPGDTVVVQNDFGRVRIRGVDSSEVLARLEMVSSGKIQPDFLVATQKNGREIYLYSFFSGQSQEAVNLEIQAPRFLNVVVWGANPEIEIQGIQGSVRVQNITGNITLYDLSSSVSASSDRGDIAYHAGTQPRGDVRIESTNGNIRCDWQITSICGHGCAPVALSPGTRNPKSAEPGSKSSLVRLAR